MNQKALRNNTFVIGVRILLGSLFFSVHFPAFASDRYQPRLIPRRVYQQSVKVAGSHIDATNLTVENGYLTGSFRAKYICRSYQGNVNTINFEIKDFNGNSIDKKQRRVTAGKEYLHSWTGAKLAPVSTITNRCLNRTDTQKMNIKIHLWNTCGENERHTRNGGGKIELTLQCSPSAISPIITPILWRYQCNGPNMFIEGTNMKSVDKNSPNQHVKCVYRAP